MDDLMRIITDMHLRFRWAVVHGLELFGLEPKVSVQSRGHDGEEKCR